MTGPAPRTLPTRWDLPALAMGLAFALMWSSAFTSARIIVAEAPPLAVSALRFAISGTLALLIARAMGQSWRLTRSQWRATIIFGICQNALYLGLFFVAMQTVEASLAAIIASLMPLFVAFASRLFLGTDLQPLGWAGLAAGLVGVVVILGARIDGGGVDLWGLGLCGIGVMALTLATLSVRGTASGGNVMAIVGLQMIVGCVPLAVVSALTESWAFVPSWTLGLAFGYTTLVPGLAATLVWFVLVNRIGAIRAASFHFLNPVFGVAFAAVLLREEVQWLDGVGVLIVTLGILAVQRAQAAGPGAA